MVYIFSSTVVDESIVIMKELKDLPLKDLIALRKNSEDVLRDRRSTRREVIAAGRDFKNAISAMNEKKLRSRLERGKRD